MKRYVHINGRVVPEGKAVVSVFDRGLNYGDGVFETIKAVDGAPAFLKEHLERLSNGVKSIGIRQRYFKDFLVEVKNGAIKKLLGANRLTEGEAYLKIIVTRGADSGGHAPSRGVRPAFIIMAKPLDSRSIERLKKKGVRAVLIKGYPPMLPGIKSLNYLPSVLGKMEAAGRGAYEGIFVGEDGFIKEGTSTNVFIVSNGVIKTPPAGKKGLSDGVLPGITRKAVIDIARNKKIPVKEAGISGKDLFGCDEAFLTNSIIEVVPLIGVDSRKTGDGRPGEVTKLLQGVFGLTMKKSTAGL